jgi:chondroitin 4-sulfotransferase 11
MPLVNDEVIFIHNIKTGGTYLRACIGNKEVRNGHETAQQSKSFIESKVWNNRFKFAVVRNPYDLMLSLYHYFRKEKWHPNANSANGSFSEFLNIYANTLHGKGVYLQQFDKVSENGSIILDKVYRYEDWNEMTKELSDRFGYEFPSERINSSNRKANDIEKIYTKKDIGIVNDLFRKDFSRLGYEMRIEKDR